MLSSTAVRVDALRFAAWNYPRGKTSQKVVTIRRAAFGRELLTEHHEPLLFGFWSVHKVCLADMTHGREGII